MNLKWTLITRIWLMALVCLVVASGHVLWQTRREQHDQLVNAIDTVSKQIRNRFATVAMGFVPTGFDRDGRFSFWDPVTGSNIDTGMCVRYIDEHDVVKASTCHGMSKSHRYGDRGAGVPVWFDGLYRAAFGVGGEETRALHWDNRDHGRIVAALDAGAQVAEAWNRVRDLISLALLTVVSLCLLVYVIVSHALRPTRDILGGLERLQRGDLSTRLPPARFAEFRRMSEGFNRMAASLEQSVAERAELTRKLVTVQEEERRYLARELHDEFGQCLAAMTALSASIVQSAEEQHSPLAEEGRHLSRITEHLMRGLRSILHRLRPAGIEELGLVESIRGIAAEYGHRGTRIELEADPALGELPETISVNVYRIVQECLTNIAKHSGASHAKVTLARVREAAPDSGWCIDVTVEDDGNAVQTSVDERKGRGLLGMRERVTALGGELKLRRGAMRGLVVHARIPLTGPV